MKKRSKKVKKNTKEINKKLLIIGIITSLIIIISFLFDENSISVASR